MSTHLVISIEFDFYSNFCKSWRVKVCAHCHVISMLGSTCCILFDKGVIHKQHQIRIRPRIQFLNIRLYVLCTVGEKKDLTKRYWWSKTIRTKGSVGRPEVDPPPRKIIKFFLMSLALSVPIYKHFQSNRANWRSSKHLTKKFIKCCII